MWLNPPRCKRGAYGLWRFDPSLAHLVTGVDAAVACRLWEPEVPGSIPGPPTRCLVDMGCARFRIQCGGRDLMPPGKAIL